MTDKVKNVLIALQWQYPELLEGIMAYSKDRYWQLDLTLFYTSYLFRGSYQYDGIIAMCYEQLLGGGIAELVAEYDATKIYLESTEADTHSVSRNYKKAAEMAFNYLQSLGHKRFYTYANKGNLFTANLKRLIVDHGYSISHIELIQGELSEDRSEWPESLQQVEFPCAVICSHNITAQYLVNDLRSAGIRIPHDVSVLTVDDDKRICENTHPSISAIDMNLFELGYKAAELLDQVMNNELGDNPGKVMVEPKGIVARESTNYFAVCNQELRSAVDYMEKSFTQAITVDDVVMHCNVSKRALERLFKQQFDRTPGDVLRHLRMQEAARLLRETDEKISYIARTVNYNSHGCFSAAFEKTFGILPKDYRQKFQL